MADSHKAAIYAAVKATHAKHPLQSRHPDDIARVCESRRVELQQAFQSIDDQHNVSVFDMQLLRREIASLPKDVARPDVERWQVLGDYDFLGGAVDLIERVSTEGATSEVWKAKSKHTRQALAVKYLAPDKIADNNVRVGLALSEIQNLFGIQHPNVVHVLGAGRLRSPTDLEVPFVMMEYLDGCTLEVWAQSQPSADRTNKDTAKIRAEIVRVLAATIRALHENPGKPIWHLDLKPSNVMVVGGTSVHADQWTLRIIDFGSGGSGTATFVVGALRYMAPERHGASLHNATALWDIYSLGGILYFLCTGEHPKAAANCTEEEWRDYLSKIDLSDSDLNLICSKCLAFRLADRYSSAKQLEESLSAFIQDRPIPHISREYSYWDKERLLIARSWNVGDPADQWTVIGQASLVVSAIFLLGAVIHALLTPHASDIVALFNQVADAIFLTGAGVALTSLGICRFRYDSFRVNVPFVSIVIASYICAFGLIPRLETLDDLVVDFKFNWLVIGLGSSVVASNAYARSPWHLIGSWLLMFGSMGVEWLASFPSIKMWLPTFHFLIMSALVYFSGIAAFDKVRQQQESADHTTR